MINRQDSTEQRRRKHMAHMDDKRMTDNTRSAVEHSKDAARLARTALGVHDRAREVITAMTDTTAPERASPKSKLSDWRTLWKLHGGDWHGPRVERWSIPEADFCDFMDAALAARVAELEAIGRAKDYDYGRAIAERDAARAEGARLRALMPEVIASLDAGGQDVSLVKDLRAAMQEGGE